MHDNHASTDKKTVERSANASLSARAQFDWRFHSMTWLAWSSNSLHSSAIVLSSRKPPEKPQK